MCQKPNAGICVDCDYRGCHRAVHVNCAVTAKLLSSPETSHERTFRGETAVFCYEHLEKSQTEIKQYGFKHVLKNDSRFRFSPERPNIRKDLEFLN